MARRTACGKSSWLGLITTIITLIGWNGECGAQSVSLSWDADPAPSVAGYYLYRGTSSGHYAIKTDVGLNTVITISGLPSGTTNYFVVRGYNASRSESPPSNEAWFVAPSGNGATSPSLTVLNPATGYPGEQVTLYGNNLSGTSSVQLGGLNAAYSVISDSELVVIVPYGAISGLLAVYTPTGIASVSFVVKPVPPPVNDNFANAQLLSGNAILTTESTLGATQEIGEPNHGGIAGGNSVWFRWTAPSSGPWTVNSAGSDFTAVMAVYTGNSLAGLTLVASNLTSNHALDSALTLNASAGTTYRIAVDQCGGTPGNLVLALGPAPAPAIIASNSFDVPEGIYYSYPLAGQGSWLALGNGNNGVKNNFFSGYSQQAFIGQGSSTPASNTLVYRPLAYAVDTNTRPLVQFSVLMQLYNLFNLFNDTFAWVVQDGSGRELFRVSFDNSSHTISYSLDNGAGPVTTGASFDGSTIYGFQLSLDYGRNRWAATLNGNVIATEQPISTKGQPTTLGAIAAAETFRSATSPGSDVMYFDNYLVLGLPATTPRIMSGLQNASLASGSALNLEVIASGAGPLNYQWYCNGSAIAGATDPILSMSGLTPAQSGNYSVKVTNSYGSAVSSANVTITSALPRALFSSPSGPQANGSATFNLSVTAGNSYRFQASTNLQDWVTLGAFTSVTTNVVCLDPAAASFKQRFYRLVSP